MKLKRVNLLLLIFSVILIAFISSCDFNQDKHNHEFSSLWTSNEKEHWHECSCGEKSDLASHTFGEWTIVTEATEATKG